ncbi:MAG: hypothetical protein AAFX45_09500 [Pseudomonadota bacterium]
MTKGLSPFQSVPGFDAVFTARNGDLRCTALRLASGALCLYSPVSGLGDAARDSLAALGEVTHLLAPNHYHNKALRDYAEAFPAATLCSTTAAAPRLHKQTGLTPTPLDSAGMDLPQAVRLIEPVGLKTGEVWIDLSIRDNRLLIVTDAFRGVKAADDTSCKTPSLLGTFPKFGVADKTAYRDWLDAYLQDAPPTMLLPCHGSRVASATLADDLLKLVAGLA